jgi:hypothetical protein
LSSYCHFQAFYKGDTSLLVEPSKSWESVLDSPLFIRGDYHLTAASHVLADPILVLHFVLISISPKGNPARVMSEILGGFLMEGSFMYEEIIFDLANNKLIRQYTDAITVLVQTLEGCVYFLFSFYCTYLAVSRSFERVVIVITNHSHDSTGDLYIGSDLCTSVDQVIVLIHINSFIKLNNGRVKFITTLFPPVLVSYLRPETTTLFMLCCGALVRERNSFGGLRSAIQ